MSQISSNNQKTASDAPWERDPISKDTNNGSVEAPWENDPIIESSSEATSTDEAPWESDPIIESSGDEVTSTDATPWLNDPVVDEPATSQDKRDVDAKYDQETPWENDPVIEDDSGGPSIDEQVSRLPAYKQYGYQSPEQVPSEIRQSDDYQAMQDQALEKARQWAIKQAKESVRRTPGFENLSESEQQQRIQSRLQQMNLGGDPQQTETKEDQDWYNWIAERVPGLEGTDLTEEEKARIEENKVKMPDEPLPEWEPPGIASDIYSPPGAPRTDQDINRAVQRTRDQIRQQLIKEAEKTPEPQMPGPEIPDEVSPDMSRLMKHMVRAKQDRLPWQEGAKRYIQALSVDNPDLTAVQKQHIAELWRRNYGKRVPESEGGKRAIDEAFVKSAADTMNVAGALDKPFVRPIATGAMQSALGLGNLGVRAAEFAGLVEPGTADTAQDVIGLLGQARRRAEEQPGHERHVPETLSSMAENTTRSLLDMYAFSKFGGSRPLPQMSAVITGFGAKAADRAITTGRNAGLDGEELASYAAAQGALEGGITALFASLGMAGLEQFKAPAKAGLKQAAKQIGYRSLSEVPEEVAVEWGQRLHDLGYEITDKRLSADEVAQTVATTLLTVGVAEGAQRASARNVGGEQLGRQLEELDDSVSRQIKEQLDGQEETQQGSEPRGPEGRQTIGEVRRVDQGRAGERPAEAQAQPAETLADVQDTAQERYRVVSEDGGPRILDTAENQVLDLRPESAEQAQQVADTMNRRPVAEAQTEDQADAGAETQIPTAEPAEQGRRDAPRRRPSEAQRNEALVRFERSVQADYPQARIRATDAQTDGDQAAATLASDLGLQAVFYESVGDTPSPPAGFEPGTNTVMLESGGDTRSANALVMHEVLGHALRRADPDTWSAMEISLQQNAPASLRRSLRRYERAREEWAQEAGVQLDSLDPDVRREEAIAALAEDMADTATDPNITREFLERVTRAVPRQQRLTLIDRIMAGLNRVLRRIGITGRLTRGERTQRENLLNQAKTKRHREAASAILSMRDAMDQMRQRARQQEGDTDAQQVTETAPDDAGRVQEPGIPQEGRDIQEGGVQVPPGGQTEALARVRNRGEALEAERDLGRTLDTEPFSKAQVVRRLRQQFGMPEGQGVTQPFNKAEYWRGMAHDYGSDTDQLMADVISMEQAGHFEKGRQRGVRLGSLEPNERIDIGNSTIEVVDKTDDWVEIERTANDNIIFNKTPPKDYQRTVPPRNVVEERGEEFSYRVPLDTVIPADPGTARRVERAGGVDVEAGQEPAPFAQRRQQADGFREELLSLNIEQRRKRQIVDQLLGTDGQGAVPTGFGYAMSSRNMGPDREQYPWRITTFDMQGRPIGHTVHKTLRGGRDSVRQELARAVNRDRYQVEGTPRFAQRRRRDTEQLSLAGEVEGRATTGDTPGMFSEQPAEATQPPREPQQAQDPTMPEGAGRYGLSQRDVANARLYSEGDPTAPFAYGVKRYQAGHDGITRVEGMTREEAQEARRGFRAAERGAPAAQREDRQQRDERDRGDTETPRLFAQRRTPQGENVTVRKDVDALGTYSALRHSVSEMNAKDTTRMTPDQVRGMLKKQPGIKPEEIQWTGLDEFLEGKDRVTKQEIQDFLKQNEVRVEEVVKSEKSPVFRQSFPSRNDLMDAIADDPQMVQPDGSLKRGLSIEQDEAGWNLYDSSPRDADTKYGDYQLPGGDNYREVLLTLPPRDPGEWNIEKQGEQYVVRSQAGSVIGRGTTEAIAREEARRNSVSEGDNYRSGHWEEPNILAHIRFNERVDENNNKMLFIEEIRSDWHQAGRDRGYRTGELSDDMYVERVGRRGGDEDYFYVRRQGEPDSVYGEGETRNDAIRDAQSRPDALGGDKVGVPDAPFKKNWHDLALKRMVRWAAANDFDAIGWTTGEQQARRYSQDEADRSAGMEGFYDRMLPIAANKIGKKYGASTQQTTIETPGADSGDTQTVNAMPITDKLRDAAMTHGLPRFAVKRAQRQGNLFNGFSLPTETTRQIIGRKLWDKFNRVKTVQQSISEQGGEFSEAMDTYIKEELYYGKAKQRLDQFNKKRVAPILRVLANSDISVDDLGTYLYARHAPERNRRIREINPEFQPGGRYAGQPGSGMATDEANEIIAQFERDGVLSKLKQAARVVDAVNKQRLDIMQQDGLIDDETRQKWESTYEYYVPLRGDPLSEEHENTIQPIRSGRGFDIRGKESQIAAGRVSRADNPFIYSLTQFEEAIVRSEKNKVGQSFLRFVRSNPDRNLWEVDKVERKPRLDPKTGTIVYGPDPLARQQPNKLAVKEGGKERMITIHDPVLAQQLKNMGAQSANEIVQFLHKGMRFLSSINTSYNPEFVVSNFLRDIQTAGFNITADESQKMARRIVGNVFGDKKRLGTGLVRGDGVIRGVYKAIHGEDTNSEWGKWFAEFQEAGGQVGWFYSDTVNDRATALEKELRYHGANPNRIKNGFRAARDFIDDVNQAVENAVRVSAYAEGRKAGWSKQQSASFAKNLTVNFNRKGEWGNWMNSMYLFYNASIQGTVRMMRSVTTKRGRRLVGGIMAFAFLQDMLNRALSDDDDDGRTFYDKLPDYEKNYNFIVMLPNTGGKYVKIPLPYGYNVFHATGRQASETVFTDRSVTETALNLAKVGMDAFNPIGGESSLLQLFSPTIFDPVVQHAQNQTFYGAPIKPEQQPYQPNKPESQLYFDSVSTMSRTVAKYLNRWTGGDAVQPGVIDISPEIIDHYTRFFTGGAGATALRTVDVTTRGITGEPIKYREVPFLRRVAGEPYRYVVKRDFYDAYTEVEFIRHAVKQYDKMGNAEKAEQVRQKHEPMLQLWGRLKHTRERLSQLNDEIEAAAGRSIQEQADRLQSEGWTREAEYLREQAKEYDLDMGVPAERLYENMQNDVIQPVQKRFNEARKQVGSPISVPGGE